MATEKPKPNPRPAPQHLNVAKQECSGEEVAAAAAANEAAAAAGKSLPSIMDLGEHLARLMRAEVAFSDLGGAATSGSVRVRSGWAADLLDDRLDAVREVIATQPAPTLPEAAVQLAVLVDFISSMPGGGAESERPAH